MREKRPRALNLSLLLVSLELSFITGREKNNCRSKCNSIDENACIIARVREIVAHAKSHLVLTELPSGVQRRKEINGNIL